MRLIFWGSRGSIPVSLNNNDLKTLFDHLIAKALRADINDLSDFKHFLAQETQKAPLSYGGNTPCIEIQSGSQQLFIDMGSGIREAGTRYFDKKEFSIFLTHLHWDHILGIPFFIPTFAEGKKITIYHVHKNAPKFIKSIFNGVNFPLRWEQLGGKFEFKRLKLYEPVTIGDIKVTPFQLDHPGESFGYRFDHNQESISVGFDSEYKRLSPEQMGGDLFAYRDLSMLVFDAQYDLDELINKADWGHSSAFIGVDLALREGIQNLVLFHHDPWASKEKLDRSAANAQAYAKTRLKYFGRKWENLNPEGPRIISAYDGLELDLTTLIKKSG